MVLTNTWTERVRESYVLNATRGLFGNRLQSETEGAEEAFDRWLAAVILEARAEGWAEAAEEHMEWFSVLERPADIGPKDPPRSPYE